METSANENLKWQTRCEGNEYSNRSAILKTKDNFFSLLAKYSK